MSTEPATPGLPAYQLIKQQLRELIARGEYQPDVPFITQREICEQYGVSMGTAVRALNDLVGEGILVRRRGRGTFVAERRATPAGNGAAPDATIAFIVHGHGPHQSEILKGLGTVASDLGYRVFVSDTSESDAHEERALYQAMEANAAGVVLYPREGDANLAVLSELRRRRIPVVVVDRYLPGFPTDAVLADNFSLGQRLTEELIALGHSRIATLWGEYQCTSVYDRSSGHVQALRERGLAVRPDFTSLRPYVDLPEASRKALLTSLLDAAEPPTALLCANGLVIATAIHDLLDLGVRVPEDIDLAGMDEVGPFELLPLACVAGVLPSYQMGATAMTMLTGRIDSDDPFAAPRHEVLPVEIRTRDASRAHLRPVSTSTGK
jgi:DNA-binding LacI/PurR family transcriptional regulator